MRLTEFEGKIRSLYLVSLFYKNDLLVPKNDIRKRIFVE